MTKTIDPRGKLYHHLDHLVALKHGKYLAPINCELMLSNRCDLRCHGCHYAYTHTRGPWVGHADKPQDSVSSGDLMDFDLACSILSQLAATGVKSVTLSGGGEPSVHPRFDDIIKHARAVGLELGIYSHGGHLRGERAAWMKENFEWIYISFDAYDVESYKQHKGVNRFERVCENVRNLVALPGKAKIGMGFLLCRDNYRFVFSMQKLARDLGVAYAQFRPLVEYNQDTPNQLAEDASWIDEAVLLLGQYANDPFVIADTERFRMYQNWAGHPYDTCRWSALQTVISPNGGVWRCTNKMEHPDALLGDLSAEPFEKIWARSGGACQTNASCRILCRGHISNIMLNELAQTPEHVNFV